MVCSRVGGTGPLALATTLPATELRALPGPRAPLPTPAAPSELSPGPWLPGACRHVLLSVCLTVCLAPPAKMKAAFWSWVWIML